VSMASSNSHSAGSSAPRAVPGSYGLPVVGNLCDRHDFYYRQGQDKYFQSRIEQYGATVLRINVPRGPFFTIDPQVVALLDGKSFPTLFDLAKVEKKDVLVGYVPPRSLTGGYRVLAYLDPSEPGHGKLKQLMFTLLHSRKDAVIPAFRSIFSSLLNGVHAQLSSGGGAVDFNKLNDVSAFQFLGEAFFGARPAPELSSSVGKWLLLMLSPLFTIGLPWIIEEPLLHSVPLPSILVRKDYTAFYDYVFAAATNTLDAAESLGFTREEACHNLVFMMGLNGYAAFKLMLPTILGSIAGAKDLHARLAAEVRDAVAKAGGEVTLAAVETMELTKSVVWEAMRLDPPVKYQYGHAKKDLEIESHDGAVYAVKKGQMLMGYQPCATRDPRVFGPTAAEFVGDRFVGEEGRQLLKYVYWSNGRETEEPSVSNKQCPGKNFVMLVGRLFVVELFLRYDTFSVQFTTGPGGNKVAFTDVTKATMTA
jgi:hydroperoxide dehydratase